MNILYLSGSDEDFLRHVIMYYTVRIISENIYQYPIMDCFLNNELLFYGPSMMKFTENYLLEKVLGSQEADINSAYNISTRFLETAGEMFIYWNLCPKFMYEWNKFYIDLMQNASPDIIVLTLNRIIKTGEQNGDKTIMEIARKLLRTISEKYSLVFQQIDALTKKSPSKQNSNQSQSQGSFL